MTSYCRAALTLASVLVVGCAPPPLQPVAPESGARAELWDESAENRELFYGVGGRELAPAERPTFTLLDRDPRGFSVSLDLRDRAGREWSAKLGEEAQSEVTSSRIVWALGYHQPPVYYLPRFTVVEGGRERAEQNARLRPKVPWLASRGTWSWYQNPFVGTQAYRGLLVLMMVLNSTDLKEDNNTVYRLTRTGRRPTEWFVVKDLGATLGATGKLGPKRNDIAEFERHGFIRAVREGRVDFHYKGRHQALLDQITVDDVVWTCRRLSALTDAQWQDAFRAGGYDEATTRRYIARIKEKVREGLALGAREARR